MDQNICLRCIRDFYTEQHDGSPKATLDPNTYLFLFSDEPGGGNWVYWWERGILHNCICTVPSMEPVGLCKALELIDCPYAVEHLVSADK